VDALVAYLVLASLADVDVPAQVRPARHELPVQIRKLEITPPTAALKIAVPPGTLLDRERARSLAVEAERQLREQGYTKAFVDYELTPVSTSKADLHLMVKSGERVRVREVAFTGDLGLPSRELQNGLRAMHARRLIPGWRLLPSYSPEAVQNDMVRLRSLYLSKGYFDAAIRVDDTSVEDKYARVRIAIESGPHYDGLNATALCSGLMAQRREAQRKGILEFAATLSVPSLEVVTDLGKPYRVRRIEFRGNRHYTEAMLRRNFLLDEGQLFDETLLRKSIGRLEQTGLFEPIDANHVSIHTDPETGMADVAILLTERKRGSWNLSGPVGPPSFAGPVQASIGTRLPSWLSSFTVSVGVAAFATPLIPTLAATKIPLFPVLALQRPFTPAEGWRSGFSIVPQLGWRASVFTYALTQMQQRLLPLLAGDNGLTTELAVAVEGSANGDGVMFCEPPKPRFTALRTTASMAVRLAGALSGL
jgi:hypothetical protein